MKRLKEHWKILLWLFVIPPVAIITYKNPEVFITFFEYSQNKSQEPWFIFSMIFVPAILFTFGLAGSVFLWLIAALYPPFIATTLLVTGATLGAFGGHQMSAWLGRQFPKERKENIESHKVFKILKTHGGFLMIFVLRAIPAFPHGVINYSAGLLQLKLPTFLLASALGIIPKTTLYCIAIYQAAQMSQPADLFRLDIILPLTLLAIAPILAGFIWPQIFKVN